MKKLMMVAVILLTSVGSVMAQNEYKRGIFNHVGLNVGAGTEGISVGLAAPVTSFFEVEAGVNVMPSFKLSGDLDVDYDSSSLPQVSGVSYPNPATIHVDGDFSLQYPDVLDADSLLLGISDWEVIFCFRHLIPCTGSRTNFLRTRYQGRVIQNLTDAVCLFWGESHAVTDAVVHQIV